MKLLLVVALLAVAADARTYYSPDRTYHLPRYDASYDTPARYSYDTSEDTPAQYSYQYEVHGYEDDAPRFTAQEERDGYSTQGSYSVALPDGRIQTVTYTVNGDEGYVATVTYEGEAQYPEYSARPAYRT